MIEINDTAVFAGFVWSVQSDLQSSRVRVQVVDMFAYMAQADIQGLGQSLDIEITEYPGAQDLYTDEDPVFLFPLHAIPIVPGSVEATMSEDSATVDIEIVDVIKTEGTLSSRRAEVDYQRGLLRFEAAPTDGADTTITAQWKIGLHYKRIDTLVRLVLDNTGIMDRVGITPTALRGFSLDQIPVTLESESFTSHGRPYPAENGVVRWLRRNGTTWQMIQDQRFVEYDEHQDEYSEVATLPVENVGEGVVNTDYGLYLEGESFDTPSNMYQGRSVSRDGDRIYHFKTDNGDDIAYIDVFRLDGTLVEDEGFNFSYSSAPTDMKAHNGVAYFIRRTGTTTWIRSYNLETGVLIHGDTSFFTSANFWLYIAIDDDYIYIKSGTGNADIRVFDKSDYDADHTVTRVTSQETAISPHGSLGDYFDVNSTHFFFFDSSSNMSNIRTVTRAGVRDADGDFSVIDFSGGHAGLSVTDTRLYFGGFGADRIEVYQLGISVEFGGYVPYQFGTVDNDTLYFLSANNTQANVLSDSTLRRVKVYRYVKSTGTWTDILNEATGQPQLAHAYQVGGEIVYLADNRKAFAAVESNSNDTLIFYRRVQATQSGIAYYNDDDDTVTNVNTFSHSGAEDYGYPYSMDFVLDERSDGIHVYTFVVRVELDSNGDYDGGWLKVYRERVEPSGTQTEIYSETFTASADDEDYAVSVSDLILADNRSKFYFTLEYHGEGDRVGKADLCTIAKSGSGSRTVLKTYENPLLSARSPAERDGSYFYLEGGWVRQGKDDPLDQTIPDDQHDYPNQGGTLIEIESNNDVTEHGQVWRSATKDDNANASEDSEIYDGWGLHNSVISNMIVDERDNLHFVAGYGVPYNIDENLPFSSLDAPVPALSNFQWLQWGTDLAAKIASFPVSGQRGLPLTQALATIGFANVGVPPTAATDARLAGETVSAWQRYASIYFRSRHDAQVTLRTAVGSGAVSQLNVDAVGLPDAGEVLFGTEIFAYNSTVTQSGVIRQLRGVTRAQHGSVASSHSAETIGIRVDGFIDAGDESEIYTVRDRALDFINQKNRVTVGLAGGNAEASDAVSIDDFGEFALSLGTSPVLFSRFDADWAELLAELYLDSLKAPKEVLAIATRLSLSVEVGQVVVVDIDYRIKIGFKAFVVTQVAHALPQAVTDIRLREV